MSEKIVDKLIHFQKNDKKWEPDFSKVVNTYFLAINFFFNNYKNLEFEELNQKNENLQEKNQLSLDLKMKLKYGKWWNDKEKNLLSQNFMWISKIQIGIQRKKDVFFFEIQKKNQQIDLNSENEQFDNKILSAIISGNIVLINDYFYIFLNESNGEIELLNTKQGLLYLNAIMEKIQGDKDEL